MEFTGKFQSDQMTLSWSDGTEISFLSPTAKKASGLLLYVKDRSVSLVTEQIQKAGDYEGLITVKPAWEVDKVYLVRGLLNAWQENGLTVASTFEEQKLPANQAVAINDYVTSLFQFLTFFGYQMGKVKRKPAKAQHRWNKAVSEIPFYVTHDGAEATVYWQKRNEMLIKKGAVLLMEAPLNKDGSEGFGVRFTKQLRQEHADQIKDGVTTEDIILKSVNEVGHFLYYAGTNSWLVLKDKEGKTIDEYTVVA